MASIQIMENSQRLKMVLEPSTLNSCSTTNNPGVSGTPNAYRLFDEGGPAKLPRSKNIYEYVTVRSSELVAELVGKKACKIKALRAKTNTYIRTPSLGQAPVFLISGRPKDVAEAKRELLADAEIITQYRTGLPPPEYITQSVTVPSSDHVAKIVGRKGWRIMPLRAKARIMAPARGERPIFIISGRPEDVEEVKRELIIAANRITASLAFRKKTAMILQSQSPAEEPIIIDVPVPRRAVGLVVGLKGTMIKSIQELTNTFIVTPPKHLKKQCFIVSGKPEDVERARRKIDCCVAMRREGSALDSDSDSEDNSPRSDTTQSKITPPYVRIAEGRSTNCASLENPPLATTPTVNQEGRMEPPKQEPPNSTHLCSSNSIEESAVSSSQPFARIVRRRSRVV